MVRDLRKAKLFPYFGIKLGTLNGFAARGFRERKRFRAYVTRVYRGQPEGIAHWRRVASEVWCAHDYILRLRKRASRTERARLQRLARKDAYRAKERERLRAFRAKERKRRGE